MDSWPSQKAAAIHHFRDDLATAIESVQAVANRCLRMSIISDDTYRAILRPPVSNEAATPRTLLLEAVEDSIRQEGTHYEKFMDVLERELEPTVAKTLTSKISYHLQETRERANLDQCTEQETASSLAPSPANEDKEHDSQEKKHPSAEKDDKSQEEKYLEGTPVESSDCQLSVSTSFSMDNHTRTSSTIRRRAVSSDPSSTEVEPVQATDGVPASSLESCLHTQRLLKFLRRLEEERFAHYDKVQQDARYRELMNEKDKLKRQLKQQSIDTCNVCEDKRKIEEEMKDERLKVDRLSKERDQIVARYQCELKQLKSQVARNERERHELEVKCKECEHQMSNTKESYESRVSQGQKEIDVLEYKLKKLKSIIEKQKTTINEKEHEVNKLCRNLQELQEEFQKKCTELDKCRLQVTEFKSNFRSLLIFVVMFVVLEMMVKFMLIMSIITYFKKSDLW